MWHIEAGESTNLKTKTVYTFAYVWKRKSKFHTIFFCHILLVSCFILGHIERCYGKLYWISNNFLIISCSQLIMFSSHWVTHMLPAMWESGESRMIGRKSDVTEFERQVTVWGTQEGWRPWRRWHHLRSTGCCHGSILLTHEHTLRHI